MTSGCRKTGCVLKLSKGSNRSGWQGGRPPVSAQAGQGVLQGYTYGAEEFEIQMK